MDKRIRMLLVKLSERYRVVITLVMTYNDVESKFSTMWKIKIATKEKKTLATLDCQSSREVLLELMKWLK